LRSSKWDFKRTSPDNVISFLEEFRPIPPYCCLSRKWHLKDSSSLSRKWHLKDSSSLSRKWHLKDSRSEVLQFRSLKRLFFSSAVLLCDSTVIVKDLSASFSAEGYQSPHSPGYCEYHIEIIVKIG
jgi:hypothetical protein